LLNSISHDLRTPLATVTGVLSSLKEAGQTNGKERVVMDAATQAELIDTALEEAERLNRLVANLLDMSRVEAGALHLKCEPSDLQDLVGAALARLSARLVHRPLQTHIAENLPLVSLDFVMMIQVMVNLLDNALKYSPQGTTLQVEANPHPDGVIITVADEGSGIPTEDLERVFDKFYRVQRPDGIKGTGLGLSICRGIVEAHGGRIWAENRPTGGAIFKLVLPVK
jgi:two-component system, OmpR family, sensor histidine kinase KdpD